jgi:RNA polymerase sigma factor (sigma-70 family)
MQLRLIESEDDNASAFAAAQVTPGRGDPREPWLAVGCNTAVVVRPLDDSQLADNELVERAKRGDVAAYEQLVRRYQEPVFRTAYLITRSSADAQDAAQEVFVKAYFALHRFRTGAPLRPWLMRIAVNESRNRRRAAGRREALSLRAAAEWTVEGADPSPEAALLAAERRCELLAALDRLREVDRLVLACRFLLDLSERETAELLGLRLGTAKSRLSRALSRLGQEIGAESS